MDQLFACPCCGYLTLSDPPPGTFEICDVCRWEDDDFQFNHPNYEGGANEESLNKAKINFLKFGASSESKIKNAREPLPNEIPPNPD
ncbi:CPCC family cysteine-rich protein [Criblamydia sequanensis]|nr:CPCC family cysteine-rich protein [Criblamydia sequanensis]